jgi:hypothetical protein
MSGMPLAYGKTDIERFSSILDSYPPRFDGNPLNLLFLEDAAPIEDPVSYLREMDGPGLLEEQREYCMHATSAWPFPAQHLSARPAPYALSLRLFDQYELARKVLVRQSDIARLLERAAGTTSADVVLLVIADGLSYYDVPPDWEARPCLVEGVTITENGYRATVGNPPLSRRLFARGYAQQRAYTYYSIEVEGLALDMHGGFSPSQVARVGSFREIESGLRTIPSGKTYIQVTLAGLDQLCHAHRDEPPVPVYRDAIFERFASLMDLLTKSGRRVLGALCADHGILWRSEIEPTIQVIDDLFREDARSPRYAKGAFHRAYGLPCVTMGHNYTVFTLPYMTRRFRSNEWGVHGGLSAWESIVPLVVREPD